MDVITYTAIKVYPEAPCSSQSKTYNFDTFSILKWLKSIFEVTMSLSSWLFISGYSIFSWFAVVWQEWDATTIISPAITTMGHAILQVVNGISWSISYCTRKITEHKMDIILLRVTIEMFITIRTINVLEARRFKLHGAFKLGISNGWNHKIRGGHCVLTSKI